MGRSIARMSPVLVELDSLVGQVSNPVIINILLLVFLVGVNQLPELVRVFNLRSDISFDFLLLDFGQLVIVNVEFLLTSKWSGD